MATDFKVTCDHCGHNLTYTGNAEDYYLSLDNRSKATSPGIGAVTMMVIQPPLDSSKHFCGIGCLAMWIQANHPRAIDLYDRQMKHREWIKQQQDASKDRQQAKE